MILPPRLPPRFTSRFPPRFTLRLPSGASFHRRELLECFVRLNIIQTLEWAQNACADACERSERSRVARLAELNAARTGGAVMGAVPDDRQAGTGDVAGFNAQKVLTTAHPNGGRVNAQQVLDILDRELRSKEIAISDLFDRYAIEIEIDIEIEIAICDLFDRYAIRSRRAGAHRAGCMRVPTTASARPQVCERRAGVRSGQ